MDTHEEVAVAEPACARLLCRPQTSAQARRAAKEFLAELDPRPGRETAESLLLVVSELVANAVRHAGGLERLIFRRGEDGRIDIVVADGCPHPPRRRRTSMQTGDETGGFGWPLVLELSDEVSVRPTDAGGKVVRATLR